MKEKAVIDRFEGEQAVLLLGDGEIQLVVPRESLPGEAKEGDWLQVEIEEGVLVDAAIDAQATARAEERIAAKLARLRKGEQLEDTTDR